MDRIGEKRLIISRLPITEAESTATPYTIPVALPQPTNIQIARIENPVGEATARIANTMQTRIALQPSATTTFLFAQSTKVAELGNAQVVPVVPVVPTQSLQTETPLTASTDTSSQTRTTFFISTAVIVCVAVVAMGLLVMVRRRKAIVKPKRQKSVNESGIDFDAWIEAR
jgi:hypothetical protein